jgi:syntaxin 6
MHNELDDQAILLNELGREMDTAENRMDTVMKKVTKLLHMSSDKRQWTVIGVLIAGIVFILFLFAIL